MEKRCDCGHTPLVIIPGIGQSKVELLDADGNKQKMAWPMDLDVEMIKKKLIPSALRMVIFRHDLGFCKKLKNTMREALDALHCEADGSSSHSVRVITYEKSLASSTEEERKYIYRMIPFFELTKKLGEDHVYFFAYHSFGRAFENAALLDEFIQKVKKETGHDKVNLLPVSLGATVTTAYLELYGEKRDVGRVVGIVPAYDGSDAVCDVIDGDLDFENYRDVLLGILGKGDTEKICKILKLVPQKLIPKCMKSLIDGACEAIIVNSPMMWGIVPGARYEALRDKYIGDAVHASMREQTDRAWQPRHDFKAFVEKQGKNGVEFYTLCGCGLPLFSRTTRVSPQSDTIVPTVSASMGAAAARLGEKLVVEDGRRPCCEDKTHNHVSPDGLFDASYSATADTTWFFNGMEHERADNCRPLFDLCERLLLTDEPMTVFTDPAYPQFCDYIKINEKR